MFANIVCIKKFDLLFKITIFKAYHTLKFMHYANCFIFKTFMQEVKFAFHLLQRLVFQAFKC